MIQRNPVAIWGTIGILVGAILREFIPDLSNDLIEAVVQFVVTVGPGFVALLYARQQVTPVADPHDNSGQKLIPEKDVI